MATLRNHRSSVMRVRLIRAGVPKVRPTIPLCMRRMIRSDLSLISLPRAAVHNVIFRAVRRYRTIPEKNFPKTSTCFVLRNKRLRQPDRMAEKAAPRRDERAARPVGREPTGGRVGPGGPAPSSKHGDAPRMGIAEDTPVPIKTLKTALCNMNQLEG